MTLTLLLVCAANECRSPAAEALLKARLEELGVTGIRTFTCGHEAAPDRSACTDALAWAAERDLDVARLRAHRSRRLDPDLIRSADLVLALDRRARAAVVRLCPASTESTFTLREAAGLSDRLSSDLRVPRHRGAARLSTFVVDLHATRGLIDLPEADVFRQPARWWRRVRVHSHDVPDAHLEPGVTHLLSRQLLVSAVDRVARSLADRDPD